MRLDDPSSVREEYATEEGLAGRKAAYRFAEGPDARLVAFEAVAEGLRSGSSRSGVVKVSWPSGSCASLDARWSQLTNPSAWWS